jgi:cytochrome P450
VGSGDNPQILSDCCCNLQDGKWVAPQDFIQSPHGREDLALFIAMECWSPQIEALICCKQIVNVREETKSLAFNVIAQFLLGSRLRSGPVNDALREDFYILCEGLLAIPIKLPGTKFSKALQARARIIETLERDVVSKPRPENDEDHYADYMENTRRENFSGMTEERLLEKTRSHMLGMMFAGHETAACAMLFAVKYISEHPDVLAELRVS